MITILLQKILAALTQLLGDIKTKLNTIKNNLDNLIVVATASGPIASFTTTITKPFISFIVNIPESESGTDTVVVTQLGKNLFDKSEILSNKYLTNDGTETNSGTYSITDFIKIKGGIQITISGATISGNAPSICFYDENKTFISGLQHGNYTFPHTYAIPDNAFYFRDSFYSDSINTIQIEVGSTATAYHAYVTATTKTVSLPSTVYGGEVDITDLITPEIKAINGVNNIFSDSGDVTIEYLKLYKED